MPSSPRFFFVSCTSKSHDRRIEMKTVKQGDSGEEIAILNNALTQAGYSVKEGMTFTPALRETVVAFQQQRGLEPDGIVGYHTWEALLLGGESEATELADEDFSRGALLLDCETAALRAVQEVESGSRHGFVAPGKPTILFEGHQRVRSVGEGPGHRSRSCRCVGQLGHVPSDGIQLCRLWREECREFCGRHATECPQPAETLRSLYPSGRHALRPAKERVGHFCPALQRSPVCRESL